MVAKVDWNDDRVEQLKAMWADGQSCSQIARQIPGATRSAVIGKIHRLGLTGRENPKRPSVTRPKCPSQPQTQFPAMPLPAELEMLSNPLVFEGGGFVTLETVSDRTCRWPIGDPQSKDFHFCGHPPKKRGRPFCEAHAKVAYQRVQTRNEVEVADGRIANSKRYPARRGHVSMWE